MKSDGGEERAQLILPQLRLDDLLAELQIRLEAVLATRDRVHALMEAVVSIGSDLDLETVLRRIIEAATTLVEARYGALGVISDDGDHLVQFVTVGVTEEQIEAIGHWPHGHGILGLLIKEPYSLRLSDLARHPESVGFPAGHPPMQRFLGVPIRVRSEVFGNLYLTEKSGGGEFDEDDEVIVTALATSAGVAIENARLFEETRRRETWLRASGEISTALLSGTPMDAVIGLVARLAREICEADTAVVSLVDTDRQEFVLAAADGAHADQFLGRRVPIEQAVAAQVYREGIALTIEDTRAAADNVGVAPGAPLGPSLIVPLGQGGQARGVLTVINSPGRPGFNATTRRLLEPFAVQAAVALELAESRRDSERLSLLEERDRIAKDLHDTVIQRLFATAMTLMSAVKLAGDKPEVSRRIQRSVDDLDDTIRQIRAAIFALQAEPDTDSLRSRIYTLVDGAAGMLGFAPSVRLDGLIDTLVDASTAEHLLAAVNEALANVVRHAHASRVDVTVEATDGLILQVVDNGVGIPEQGRRSGLRNLADRAISLGGSFEVRARDGGGTALEWRVPLP